jgi:hypothetical protein
MRRHFHGAVDGVHIWLHLLSVQVRKSVAWEATTIGDALE